MEGPVPPEEILAIALQILIGEKKQLEVTFFPDQVRILLPPKRTLAAAGGLPMAKITAALAQMEQDRLVVAEQRGGIWTTPAGNRILGRLLAGTYRDQAGTILGPVVLATLLQRLRAP